MHPHRLYEADNLLANITLLEHATHLNTVLKTTPRLSTLFGIKSIGQVLAHPEMFRARFDKLANDLDDVKQLERCKATVKTFTKAYPDVMKRLGVAYVSGTLDIVNDTFINSSAEEIKEYLAYKKRVQDVVAYFSEMTGDTYGSLMSDLKQITATELSHKADKRLLNFVSEQPETFATIRNALRTGQSLTPGQFGGLRSIYPVILADVHNYSTYLPLKYGLIDLLIIDGAANIGIAEALPALLRAKKVLVLGDAKSSALFPNETIDHTLNDLHRDRLGRSFSATLQGVSADVKNQQLARLHQNFDVRQSVLGFARAAANYEIKLTKYFRSAPELISYVNKTFYGDTLRCLNARTEPLSDLIRFTHVKTAKGAEADLHTNIGEAKRIIEELTAMRQADYRGTIGIVTPYPQQALLLQKELDECVISDWFEKRQLKVMTLDTARGISRNYVFYSMVSNNAFDDLDHVLPGHPERLCAGLSRATEVVHFVLSKPIEEFSGASGDMLAHFQSKLSTGNVRTSSVSDVLMAAESLFPQYFYATGFYKKHRENAQLVTQFSLGDLTKALSSKVTYPPYKVDFLIALGRHRIIITYDEFKANFLSGSKDLQTNYLTTTDIYDQKILETYGYTFLRLNKFNLGSKPAETLNKLLQRATTQSSWARDNGYAE